MISKYHEFFPEKVKYVSSDDQPFINQKLKRIKRVKSCDYHKHRRSKKWEFLDGKYQAELGKTKKGFYRNRIKQLRKLKPSKWHAELKKLTSYDQQKAEEIIVETIKHLPISEQAELIADRFASVSQEFDRLETGDIDVPSFSSEQIPQFDENQVKEVLSQMDTNKSNVCGDISAKGKG